MRERDEDEPTYPLRAASRLTGLSPEVLRAWERRYGKRKAGHAVLEQAAEQER